MRKRLSGTRLGGCQLEGTDRTATQVSKHALNRLIELIAIENTTVKAFSMHPGAVATEISKTSGLEEKGVHGHYVSIERIKELDNGKVEWRLATSSRAEGNIPQFMTERSMASSISRVGIHAYAVHRSRD